MAFLDPTVLLGGNTGKKTLFRHLFDQLAAESVFLLVFLDRRCDSLFGEIPRHFAHFFVFGGQGEIHGVFLLSGYAGAVSQDMQREHITTSIGPSHGSVLVFKTKTA
jgi:hypothetical protein